MFINMPMDFLERTLGSTYYKTPVTQAESHTIWIGLRIQRMEFGFITVTGNRGIKIPKRDTAEEIGQPQLEEWKNRVEILAPGHYMETELRFWVLPSMITFQDFDLNSRKSYALGTKTRHWGIFPRTNHNMKTDPVKASHQASTLSRWSVSDLTGR